MAKKKSVKTEDNRNSQPRSETSGNAVEKKSVGGQDGKSGQGEEPEEEGQTPEPSRTEEGAGGETTGAERETRPLLVGIGASAGGLAAINAFLDNYGPDGRCVLFIVQHQSRDADRSTLADLLKKHTEHEVLVAENGAGYEPGKIYVAPPGKILTVQGGKMLLEEREGRGSHMTIDAFLRTMAKEAGGRTCAVILSGSNTDGALGARAVKEGNGLVLAQNPDTAEHPTMPKAVIDENLTDLVLDPGEMPPHIKAFAEKLQKAPPETASRTETMATPSRDKLLMLLQNRTHQDFSRYKENTVNRRIRRRMTVHQLERTEDYTRYVREHPEEADALFKDLLIGVTNFFRDPEVFEALKDILTREHLPKTEKKDFRVWVTGCATGEEAYSVAIVLQEALDELDRSMDVNIYATDLDKEAIERARRGVFPQNIEADVSQKRLKRFFVERDGRFEIKKDIRDMVVFAVQNVVQDPPFSKLDLVCCRNLLMYLKPDAQQMVLSQFHYALKPQGLLLLGTSESVTALGKIFHPLDKKHRIFRLGPATERSALPRNMDMPDFQGRHQKQEKREPGSTHASPDFRQAGKQAILDAHPPAVLVTRSGEILHYHGRTGKYLEPPQGPPSDNIQDMARKGLSYDLTAALTRASARDEEQFRHGIKVRTNDHEEAVDLHVMPVEREYCPEPCFLVTFRKARDSGDHSRSETTLSQDLPREARERIRELEDDLRHTREDMQAMIEEYEASNEELKSSNEELQSTNEEFKSTNEELETAKEELQSINEEQSTLNSELQSKNQELAHVRDDLSNLLAGTRIATLFLDQELRIRRFTPAMEEVMGLRESDEGRPVGEMRMKLDYADLEKDADKVLRELNAVEREVKGEGGTWYMMRIVPYRTTENVIDGVVVTFSNITRLKSSEAEAKNAQALAESIVDTVREPLLVLDQDLGIETTNRTFLELFRLQRVQVEKTLLYDLQNGQWDIPDLRRLLEEIIPQRTEIEDYVIEHDFPEAGNKRLHLNVRSVALEGGESGRILLAVTRVEDVEG